MSSSFDGQTAELKFVVGGWYVFLFNDADFGKDT